MTRKDQLLTLITREANEAITEIGKIAWWLPLIQRGELTYEEARNIIPELLPRVRAMIMPPNMVVIWQDPVDGWQHLQEEKPNDVR